MPNIFLNSKFLEESKASISINDHGFLYGDGIYETMRTYNGKVWLFNEHLDRLFNSAKILNLKIPWTRKQIEEWIYELIKKNTNRKSQIANRNFRIRLTITRGNNDFDFFTTKNATILITAKPLIEEEQKKGLKLISFQGERTVPQAKHLSQIINIIARQQANRKKVDDAVLVDERNYISECAFSNIFMIKDGMLKTPKLNNILSGTTRKFILSFANKILPTKECKIKLKELYNADEIFLSVTTKGILFVNQIDRHRIGNGKIGEYTLKIKKIFESKTAYMKNK